jgi:hypothetical protein
MNFKCLSTLFLLFVFTGLARAQTTLSPIGTNDNQVLINQALQNGDVYLNPGAYDITGQVKIGSNTRLTGSPDAILRVSSSSSQWFVDGVGVIGAIREPLKNIEISGFQIDGNCENLPRSYANSGPGDHNAERLIDLRCDSGNFGNNISVHEMKLYDAYSDGVHIAFANNVNCYNNFCSNCQHDAIYYVNVLGGTVSNNEIAGITDDCSRLDNCQDIKVTGNTFYSYAGDHNSGYYEHGENGIQIGDQGFSHGGGSPKPDHTQDIEVFGNIFADCGLASISLDEAGQAQSSNVYCHYNKFVDVNGVNTSGISFTNPPTIEQSKQIFTSIFDILKQDFSYQYLDTEIPINASVCVTEYNNSYNPHSLVYVVGEGLSNVLYVYDGRSTNHCFLINGEPSDLWSGDLQHEGNAVYLPGRFDASKLQITCYNSQGYCKITNFNITEVPDDSGQILNPSLWAFVGTLAILGFSIYRNFRRVIRKW